MGDIVNLRQFRKRRAREEEAQTADENRTRFGRTRGQKAEEAARKAKAERDLDGHERE